MQVFKLPDLGEGLLEAELLDWKVSPGDWVKEDQLILEVETAKAIVEIPAPMSGRIERLLAAAGDTVKTGSALLVYADTLPESQSLSSDRGAIVGDIHQDSSVDLGNFSVMSRHPYLPSSKDHKEAPDRDFESPQINRGTAEQAMDSVRRSMCKTMQAAHQQVPQVSLFDDADITHWHDGEDITLRLMQAMAKACKEQSNVNAWFDKEAMTRILHEQVDIGIAVNTDTGLFVPVMRDVDRRSASDLRSGLNQLKLAVINRTIPPKEMLNPTILLSNFGTLGGRYATPMVTPPCVTILGAGKIYRQLTLEGAEVRERRYLPLSLSIDHRVVTGGEASDFLQRVIMALQQSDDH